MLREESIIGIMVYWSFSKFDLVDLVIIHFSFHPHFFLIIIQKIELLLLEMASFIFVSDVDYVIIMSFELYQKVVSITKSIISVNKDRFVLIFFLYGEDNFLVHPKDLGEKLRVVLIWTMLVVLIAVPQGGKSSEVVIVKGRLILMEVLDNNESIP